MSCEVLTSGYVSMDHMLRIKNSARVGFTSLILNDTCNKIFYGGCSVNIAYALSKLGKKAMPVLRVGRDWEANGFKAFLIDGNISLEATRVIESELTSSSWLIQDDDGQHITCFYPGSMDGKYAASLDRSLFDGVRYGVITVAALSDNREFYQRCREAGVPVVFGMKADAEAFPRPFLDELLYHSKVIFTNESERKTIEHELGLNDITNLMDKGEAEVIVTTYGSTGSTYYHRATPVGRIDSKCVPACQCSSVVDCTGGGDAYMSGFLYGLLDHYSLEDCCRLGSTLSSFVLEQEGCCTGIPTRQQFLNRFKKFCMC